MPRLCLSNIGQWVVFLGCPRFAGIIFLSIMKKIVSVNDPLHLKGEDRASSRA